MIGRMVEPLLPYIGKAFASTAGRIAPSLLGRLTLSWRVARAVSKLSHDRGWVVSRRVLRRSIGWKLVFEELLKSESDQYPSLLRAAREALIKPRDVHTIQQLTTLIADEFIGRLPDGEAGRAHNSRLNAKMLGEVREIANKIHGAAGPTSPQDGGERPILSNGVKVSNLHLIPRTTTLVVREDVEERCRDVLAKGKLLVLSGPPGTGKSVVAGQLALSSTSRVRWWIDGHSEESIEVSVVSLLRGLGFGANSAPMDELRRLLSEEDDVILIIDNVVNAKQLHALVPAELRSTIVVTTTNPLVGGEDNGVPVRMLTPDQGNELYRRLTHDSSAEKASVDGVERLTKALGYSPLAIRQAAAYARASGLVPLALQDRLTISPRTFLAQHGPSDYPEPISRVHDLARESVVKSEPGANVALVLIALSGPGGITRQLLNACEPKPAQALQLDRALAALSKAGLAQISEGRVTCHSLTAALELESVRPRLRQALARRVVTYAEALRATGKLEDIDVALSALAPMLKAANLRGDKNTYIRLSLLVFAVKQGRLQAALSISTALRGTLGRKREDDRIIMALLIQEAAFLVNLGHPRRAIARAEDATKRAVALNDKTSTVQALTLSSFCQSELGDRAGAVRLMKQAISQVPASDLETGELLQSELARLEARSTEPANEANALLKMRETCRSGTPRWAFLSTLAGRALATIGEGQRAVELTQEALAVDREIFGEKSNPVARDMNDLGSAFIVLEDLDEAENWLRQSRDIYREIGEGEHPHMGPPTLNLGRVTFMRATSSQPAERRVGLVKDATALLEEAVRLNSIEDSEGTDLASSLVALGDALMLSPQQDDHKRALNYFTRAAAIDSRELGADHAEVVIDSLRAVAAHLALKDFDGAAKVLDRVDAVLRGNSGLPESRVEATFFRILLELVPSAPDVTRVKLLASRLLRFESDPKTPGRARALATHLIDQAPADLRTLVGPRTAPAPGDSFFHTPPPRKDNA